MGATHISIYDHESTDNIVEVLKPYLHGSTRAKDKYFPEIELIKWPPRYETEDLLRKYREFKFGEPDELNDRMIKCASGEGAYNMHASAKCQRVMIADCIARYRNHRNWISFFDVDEFVWAYDSTNENHNYLPTITALEKMDIDRPTASLNQISFGTSGFQSRDDYKGKLLVESHLQRCPIYELGEDEGKLREITLGCNQSADGHPLCLRGGGKYIARAGHNVKWSIKDATAHDLSGFNDYWWTGHTLRMNHYMMKSVEEAQQGSKKQNKVYAYHAALYASNFWNAIFDNKLLIYVLELNNRILNK